MRATCLSVTLASLVVLAGQPGLSAQATVSTGPVPRAEAVELGNLVDGIAGGKPAGGDAWLKWSGHFLHAADGRVHVPFTVTLDEVETGFESIAMYVRILPRGAKGAADTSRVSGSGGGSSMPTLVSAPESQFARGNPTAGEASARMGLLASELGAVKPPYEGFFVARTPAKPAPLIVRRSLVVAPGDYDLYVAVRERPMARGRAAPKWAVLRQTLTVPDLGGTDPTMSSIILADRIEALAKHLSPSQEAERPYAFGSAEIFPDADSTFAAVDVLVVVFFAYNLAVDNGNLPDVTVEFRFRQMSLFGKIFGELTPQRLGRAHTAPVFDFKAGRQLAVTQALPLTSFPRDNYELEVAVTDNLSGRSVQRVVRFTVGG